MTHATSFFAKRFYMREARMHERLSLSPTHHRPRSMVSPSPSSKRIKLENETYKHLEEEVEITQLEEEPNQKGSEDSCSICLHSIVDRTVIPKCSHEFCFECLLIWTEQSRRCPLCSQAIGEYLIHSIRSRYDYRKHYLTPLRTSPPPFRPAQTNTVLQTTRQRRREREWGTRTRESDEADKLERSIAKRRWIYRHDLYVKHVASNAYTKYRPYPTPAQFAASQDLISRMTTFLRRELQIWEGLDVEFLTTLIISLMKSIDIRSESAVKLISEFLDMDAPYTAGGRHVNAEHFAHEVYSYARSPYKDLFVYDTVAQYDTPPHLPQPTDVERSHRWYEPSPIRNEPPANGRHHSQKRSRSSSSERSTSWSPSGRKYSPTRKMGGSGHRRTPISRGNSQSPRPSCDIPKSWDERLQTADSGHIGRQNQSADSSQTPVASSSNERGKEMPIFSMERDLKGKGKVDGIGMTTSLAGGPDFKIMDSTFGQPPLETEGANERDDQPRNMKPIKIFRAPRNRTLLDSVKAHLGESAQQNRVDPSLSNPHISSSIVSQTDDPVPALLTRLSDPPYVPAANSTKARNMSDDCQQIAGDYGKGNDPGQNLSHHDIDDSINASPFRWQQRRQSSPSHSQDGTQTGPNCSTTMEKEKPTGSKNNDVTVLSTNVISQSSPISSASPIPCQNNAATSTTVENKTMTISPYQCIQSRSLPEPNSSQKQVDNDNPPNQFHNQNIPHMQQPPRLFIDAVGSLNLPNQSRPLPHSTSLHSVETRRRLLARLEIEKRQVVQLSAEDKNQFDDGPSCSSSFTVSRKSLPFDRVKLHEREPGVLDLASDPTVSEESRKNESKLRARAQLRVRLAAEKRLGGLM